MIISSKTNDKFKRLCKFREPKYARAENKCVIETAKVVSDAISKINIDSIYVEISSIDKYKQLLQNVSCDIYYIDPNLCKIVSDTATPSDIFAIVDIPRCEHTSDRYLVLDGVQDPSNIGSIIRCAKAFGFDTIYAIDSAFAYSSKVIRSSMGYVFDVSIITMTREQFSENRFENLYYADMSGKELYKIQSLPQKLGILLGSEGQGVSEMAKSKCVGAIRVPMTNSVESLNVSVACGIILSYINYKF